ncbi:hypothetical protein BSE24067_04732 [Burkholderia seminalis]|nr:hypothetical protein BSE24067_04732 [Burkholderia seminalis]
MRRPGRRSEPPGPARECASGRRKRLPFLVTRPRAGPPPTCLPEPSAARRALRGGRSRVPRGAPTGAASPILTVDLPAACKLLPFLTVCSMVQAPPRPALSGPTLVRLLARLADADVAESRQTLSDRLSQWLGWTDAITLSSALNASPPGVAAGVRGYDAERDCARVRHDLAQAITATHRPRARRRPGDLPPPAADTADFADFRQRYLTLQQDMETAIGQLRGRLRVALAARSSGMARLATLDTIMERVLGARERSLLSAVPALLGTRFARLRDAERQALADAESAAAAAAAADPAGSADDGAAAGTTAVAAIVPGTWLDTFRDEMQSILLAELEVRFQTVDGLLAALRTC